MKTINARACWRKDLSVFRGLSGQEKAGFLLLLEWFENFRLRYELEAGREAAVVAGNAVSLQDTGEAGVF